MKDISSPSAPSGDIRIRPAVADDAEAFVRTLRDSIRQVAAADYPPEVVESWAPELNAASIAYYHTNPEGEVRIVAEVSGEVLGIGATVIERSELRACYVSPSRAEARNRLRHRGGPRAHSDAKRAAPL